MNLFIGLLVMTMGVAVTLGNSLFAVSAQTQAETGAAQQGSALVLPMNLTKLHVTSLISAHYVTTSVAATYVNPSNEAQESVFAYQLTPWAYISSFSIDVDGTVYLAEIMEKEAARTAFKKAKRLGQSAGYARNSGSPLEFAVDLNVAPGSTVTFHLGYEELLKRDNGEYTHRVNIAPGQTVDDLKVESFIFEQQGLTDFRSYWIPSTDSFQSSIDSDYQEGMQKTSTRFTPTTEEQERVDPENGINGTFVIKYDVQFRPIEGSIQTNEGYFVHFISTDDLPPAPKKVVFVIDVSGSMYGSKLKQTKTALKAILRQLRENDFFNILVFSTQVHAWQESAIPVTTDNLQQGIDFVDTLFASGGTSIHGSLVEAAAQFAEPEAAFPAIIFMTDGVPSVGETRSDIIVEAVTGAIDGNAALFCLGFGEDVDDLLLKRLAARNSGLFRKVQDDENAALQMEGFFQEVATPLLYNVRVTYEEDAVSTDTLTQDSFISYFSGKELIIAGKLNDDFDGPAMKGRMTADSANGPIELEIWQDIIQMPPMPNMVDAFTERIWAYLMIRQLLVQEELATSTKVKTALRDRALELSLKYQLVTPLTALIFYEPTGAAAMRPEPEELILPLTGIYQSSQVFGDPHFLISIPNSNMTICFDVHGDDGTIVNLLSDSRLDVLVNGKMTPFTHNPEPGNATQNTLFSRIGIKLGHHKVVVAPLHVFVDFEVSYTWKKKKTITLDKYIVEIKEKGLVTISRDDSIVMNIQRLLWKGHTTHFDFYLVKGEGFSNRVHGIVGQFLQKNMKIEDTTRRTRTGLVQGVMNINEEEIYVYHRTNFTNRGVECWWSKADDYLDGKTEQYIVPTLFDDMRHKFV